MLFLLITFFKNKNILIFTKKISAFFQNLKKKLKMRAKILKTQEKKLSLSEF